MHHRSNDGVPKKENATGTAQTKVITRHVEAPSLPKGGGAISGMGEQFTFHPANGTGSCSIPIYTSPGRQGFGPQLALSYDSGQGNGPFGLGWKLSVPDISRKTAKGLPHYIDDGEQADTFVLQGQDDLVPSLEKQRYQDGYSIQRYHPRIEGDFARIERWKHGLSGSIHWRIISRDNVLSIYGQTDEACIADPDDPSRVFSWLLQETRDDKGNIIQYEYKQENLEGLHAASASERGRLSRRSKPVNRYLKSILYGNQQPYIPDRWLFRVVFDYGEHDPNRPQVEESSPWHLRQDPFSTYRAGFDIRTYRLCQRILMFHHMEELGSEPCPVRSTELNYQEHSKVTLLTEARQTGWIRDPITDTYHTKSMPPLSFEYTALSIQDTIQTLDEESLLQLPYGVDGSHYQWVDLYGEGIPGVLAAQSDTLYYKGNLGDGRLGQMKELRVQPSILPEVDHQLRMIDLANEGQRSFVQYSGDLPGYYEMSVEGTWDSFVPFHSLPHIDWDDPSLYFVDLDGDGLPDMILNVQDELVWHPSLGKEGFDSLQKKLRTLDAQQEPRMILGAHSRTEALYFADMNGDGLSDLVRIRPAEVCYWPNLGHGRFGARMTMDDAPCFDEPDQFDPSRIHFADLDSSGTTDLLYIGHAGVRIWFNYAGNSWSSPYELHSLPRTDHLSSVAVADILGHGTSCLVWSSPLPGNMGTQVRYIDLLGGKKPYLLSSYANNLGMKTVLHYSSSTQFYLQDAAAGTPWITKLPFPVQVVEKIEYIDHVLGRNYAQQFSYHHGYYDRIEKEFRGFGLVEQWDVESFAPQEELDQPPVYTKTWYHTGSVQDRLSIAKQYSAEYYAGDQQASTLAASTLPTELTATELQEACRALRGKMLRQEVYGLDGSSFEVHPYQVSEQAYHIACIQRQEERSHAVILATEREKLEWHYERQPDDPRISHHMVLQMDLYGNVTQSAELNYPRRHPTCDEQKRLFALLKESNYINITDQVDGYRIGIPLSTHEYELTGLAAATNEICNVQYILNVVKEADEIPFEASPREDTYSKRLLGCQKFMYYQDDLSRQLPFGEAESKALTFQSLQLAFNQNMLRQLYDNKVDLHALSTEGGYLMQEQMWWIPSYRPVYDAERFYQIVQEVDPFQSVYTYEYDRYALLIERTIDPPPFDQASTCYHYNYRTLQPDQVTDPNGNRQAVQYDELGMVIATAVMGKEGQQESDTLADPTTQVMYEMSNWLEKGKPNYVYTRHREEHGAANTRWQESYVYYGGFGQEILTKAQAGSGWAEIAATSRDPEPPRWIGSGRTIFNNKGNAVKQFEPYFSNTPGYEEDSELVQHGVSPIFRYDPLDRLIRTDHPNGTYTLVEFNSWECAYWDENDTVKSSLWYANRINMDPTSPEHATEIRAAKLAAEADSTPMMEQLNSRGHTIRKIEDNGASGKFVTEIQVDIHGSTLGLLDARGVRTMTHQYDMVGRKFVIHSQDAGVRQQLPNAMGEPMRVWDSRGSQMRMVYDALQRQTHLFVQRENAQEQLAERLIYGEAVDGAQVKNLHRQLYLHFDGAGVVCYDLYDHAGNVLQQSRRFTKRYDVEVDWAELHECQDMGNIWNQADPMLESESILSKQQFDALHRITLRTMPDQTEIKPLYNQANLLEQVQVKSPGDQQWATYIQSIDYDAKGQRSHIVYGNGITTSYEYEPETFRLSRIVSIRSTDRAVLQQLRYTYDPVGNVLEVQDESQDSTFYDNARISPSGQFEYDPLYRLVKANGRESAEQSHHNDRQALCRYTETYEYDEVGNILQLNHRANGNGSMNWNRKYSYADHSNRLIATSLPANGQQELSTAKYEYDENGNITRMSHLNEIVWDVHDRLLQADLGGGGTAYYQYDSNGIRVRKVVLRSGSSVVERKYLTGYELFRRWNSKGIQFERQTLYVMDGKSRIAQLERLTMDKGTEITAPAIVSRYHFSNHLGSTSLELDEAGAIISYEEYYPFGGTSYWATTSSVEVSMKLYRYNGKEKDEESGLYYYGQRYYAASLGRWLSCDRIFLSDPLGKMPYVYVNNNPLTMIDPDGNNGESAQKSKTSDESTFLNMRLGVQSTSTLLAKDLFVRFNYYERSIYSMALKNKASITGVISSYQEALRSGNSKLSSMYYEQAKHIAMSSYEHRNWTRQITRYMQSLGMHSYSKTIEKNHGTFKDVFMKIKNRMSSPGKHVDNIEVYRQITENAAKSRPEIKGPALTYYRFGGITSLFTFSMGIHRIWSAPQGQKGEIAAEETGGLVGGMVGSSVISVGGVKVGNFASRNLSQYVPKNISALPVVRGMNPAFLAMLVFGIVGGYFGSQFGTEQGKKIYKDRRD